MIHSRAYRFTSLSASVGLRLSLALGAASLILPACDSSGTVTNGDGGAGDGDGGGADAFVPPGGDGDGGPGCPAVNVNLAPVVPTVLLLLDQSGSMTTTFGTGTNAPSRYNAMKAALVDATSGVVTQLQSSVIFGASLYTSHNGTLDGEACPILQSVAPKLSNLTDIKSLLDDNAPDGDTPTGESISVAIGILQNAGSDPDAPPSPKIIVLATDGEPDTCAVPNPQQGQTQAVTAAKAAFAAGFPLFILAVGDEVGAPHQQDMANAGAGKPLDHSQGDAPFYTADNPAELQAKFNEIIGGVRPPDCTFAISSPVDPARASEGTVKLNGQTLGYDDPNGWSLVDASTLKLNGTACDAFLADPEVSLFAQFPCGVVVE
jgi:hypothetical protein